MSLKGKLLDSESNEGLSYATISIFTKDSILISGGISDESGKFRIEFQPRDVIKKIRENRTSSVASPNTRGFNLYANISYVGFESKNIDLSYSFENTEIDLKNIYLSSDATSLDEVTVRAEKSSLELKLDKRVFNVGKDLSNKGGTAEEILENILCQIL